jgi:hypothetical protein
VYFPTEDFNSMRISIIIGFLVFSSLLLQAQAERWTTAGEIGLTMTNVGTIGNAFKGNFQLQNAPSCEYPRSSGVEHLFEGGLWVGAIYRGAKTVSSGAYDNSKGYSTGTGGFEFTAEQGAGFTERSSLFNSKYFSQEAISHQDLICDFTDKNILVPGTEIQIQDHDQPLGLDIHLESYNWNYAFADFFVILNYTITNNGDDVLDSVYVGMFANGVVRNINVTPAGSGGTAFYNKGGNGYNDSLHLAYTFDANGDPGFTESYFSHKFLGAEDKNGYHHPDVDRSFRVNYNGWTWRNSSEPIFFSPADDARKYQKLESGLNYKPDWNEVNDTVPPVVGGPYLYEKLKAPGNRSDLLSVGPFSALAPGESLNVNFAIVCAKKFNDGLPNTDNTPAQQLNLINNANWAQSAYQGEDKNNNGQLDEGEDVNKNGRLDRYVLPAPPESPVTRFVPRDKGLDIYWSNNSESSIDPISRLEDFAGYRIYLSKLGFDVQQNIDVRKSLKEVAMFDKTGDSLFYETGFEKILLAEPIYFDGDTTPYLYKYSIEGLLNGWQYVVAVSAFDTGDETNNLESLESSPVASSKRVFMGTPPNEDPKSEGPFVYPNPYYLQSAFEGYSQRQTTKKIYFANLPEKCVVRIFNMAGDLIDEFEHDSNYNGSDNEWYQQFSDEENTVFSGGEHSWDLLSSEGQNVARGLYMFTVKDLNTNKLYKGKFTLIK